MRGNRQSDLHWAWFAQFAAKLKGDEKSEAQTKHYQRTFDYWLTPDTVFGTFPWPQSPTLAQAALDSAVRAAYGMNATEDTLALLLALNLELADTGTKGVQLTPSGPLVLAGEPAQFMSEDCVTVREGERG